MTYRGRIKNGVVVFDEEVPLTDGTAVNVEPVVADAPPGTLGAKLLKYAGKAEDLPSDMARNHDHYLYGVPKK